MPIKVTVTAKSRTLTNGNANDGTIVEAIQTELYNNDDTLKSAINTIAGEDTVKSGVDGKFLITRYSFSGTPASGEHCGLEIERGASTNVQLRWNETSDIWEITADGTNYYPILNANSLRNFNATATPVYATAATFTVASINCSDSTVATLITKSGSTTVDISTNGLNGCAQSSNLTGTVTVSSGSTGITFSDSQNGVFQAGDVITTAGGQARRIVSGSGTSWVAESNFSSNETTVTFKRGGEAPSTWYNLYATTDGTTPGLILSTRNVAGGDTLVDLPSGYSLYRQLPFALRNNGSGNFVPFKVACGWPYKPYILYRDFESSSTYMVLNAGTANTFTAIDLSALVPPISQMAKIQAQTEYGSTNNSAYMRATGSGLSTGILVGMARTDGRYTVGDFDIPTNSSQSIDYAWNGATANTLNAYVRGFYVTEI